MKDYSGAVPLEQTADIATTAGSRTIDITTLADRVMVEAVEYPVGRFPPCYQRFSLWGDSLTLLGEEVPDGGDCCVYYGSLHTLDGSGSTIPVQYEELIVGGACGYAAVEEAGGAINTVNIGGAGTVGEWEVWGKEKLTFFRAELKRLGRRNRVRVRSMYVSV